MGIPQIIIIILYATALLISAYEHGKPKEEGKNNFWIAFFGIAIQTGLLIWGGFFK